MSLMELLLNHETLISVIRYFVSGSVQTAESWDVAEAQISLWQFIMIYLSLEKKKML